MCVTAIILAASAAVASTASGISAAKTNRRAAEYQFEVDEITRRQNQRQDEIAAYEEELSRQRAFRKMRANALATIAASGIDQDISFLKGIDPDNQRMLALDLGSVRTSLAVRMEASRLQGGLNLLERSVARKNARMSIIESLASGASQIGNIADFRTQYRIPKRTA